MCSKLSLLVLQNQLKAALKKSALLGMRIVRLVKVRALNLERLRLDAQCVMALDILSIR